MALETSALRLTGRDVLPLLHRTTSNALADLGRAQARATLFCDYRGRLLHRAVVVVAPDGSVWLLRPDGPGAELAATVDRLVFRDDVRIEDLSGPVQVRLVPVPADGTAQGPAVSFRADVTATPIPVHVATGDGTALETGEGATLSERERIVGLHPRHGHEIDEAFNPFEVGLAHEVHLAKGCFTGQEALQRLITYDSVRRRPVHVQLSGEHADDARTLPCDILAAGERAGVLTSAAARDGFALVKRDVLSAGTALSLGDGTALEVVSAPELARPLGRP